MFQVRISYPAQADLEHILAVSAERWGEDGQMRYRSLLAAALRAIGSNPNGPTTRDRSALLPGIRSFHIRHLRSARGVRDPVHIIYYRIRRTSIEIVRVLHERMDPSAHLQRKQQRIPTDM